MAMMFSRFGRRRLRVSVSIGGPSFARLAHVPRISALGPASLGRLATIASLLAFALGPVPALAAPRCTHDLGLALGRRAGPIAVTDGGLETLAGHLLLAAGDHALAASESAGVRTHVTFDGETLRVIAEGPCPAVIAIQRARLSGLITPIREGPETLAPPLPALPALAPLRAIVSLARAAHLALGARAEGASSDALALIAEALREGPLVTSPAIGTIPAARATRQSDAPRVPRARAMALPPRDGLSHLTLVWSLPSDGPLVAPLLGHAGGALSTRLRAAHALASDLETAWFPALRLLVIEAAVLGDDVRAARDAIFAELARLPISPHEFDGALALAAIPRSDAPTSPSGLARLIRTELVADRATLLHAPPRPDLSLAFPVVDAELVGRWLDASVDLRCPAPGESRDRMTLLSEVHGFDPRRFLALSRLLGRELDAMQQLNLEVTDRCNELDKLRSLLPARRLHALHRELACGPPRSPEETHAHLTRTCRRFGIDPSAYRPLLAMARREPALRDEVRRIDTECGGPR